MKIELRKMVVDYLCYQAEIGYETMYKQERMGFLFGSRRQNRILVTKALFYRGGKKGRTGIIYHPDDFIKRGRELASTFRKRWIGSYHTHVEESKNISFGFSPEDRRSFLKEPTLIELVITVWSTGKSRFRSPGKKRLLILKNYGAINYRYIISGITKTETGATLTKTVITPVK